LRSRILLSDRKPDVIQISEVRPKNFRFETEPSSYNLEGYDMDFINLSGTVGRGMILYVRSSLNYSFNSASSYVDFLVHEALIVEIKLSSQETVCVCTVYRSPNSDFNNNNNLNILLKCLANKDFSHLVVVGDFNFNDIDWCILRSKGGINSASFNFVETIKDCFLNKHVTEPTRGRGSDKPSLIDLILTNQEHIQSLQLEAPLGKSDHSVLKFQINCTVKNGNRPPRRIYDKGDYNLLRQHLSLDWEAELGERGDVEEKWNFFVDRLNMAVNNAIPLSRSSPDKKLQYKHKAALDNKTLKKIKRKNRLWKNYVKTGDPKTHAEYCKTRNQVRRLTRQAQKQKEKLLAHEVKQNPKKFWKYVGTKTKYKTGIPNLNMETVDHVQTKTTNDKEKADVLANFFSSVFTREPEGAWDLPEGPQPEFSLEYDLSEQAVLKLLEKINVAKSPGADCIHPRVLYEAKGELSKPLSLIFQCSMDTGKVPQDWKIANITAIFKKGNKSDAGNYRPVSLTSIVCKLMETLVRNSLVDFMNRNNYFSDKQYGFISGRSTVLQLIRVLDTWTEILDRGGCVDVIYCDFMKAFDKVPHKRLCQVLQYYGITGSVLSWITDFLTDRRQRVLVNGVESAWHDVLSGIPQGSVLGPILFVIYINSLPGVATNSHVYLFADDTKVFREIMTNDDCDKLQQDIDRMYDWTGDSLLKFHPDKCASMRIGKTKLENHDYVMGPDRTTLKHSKVERDIGVYVDEKLTFDEHIHNKVNKANSTMGIIRRTFEYLDETTFLLLYKALVRPHVEYANQVWSPIYKRQETVVENVQRRATKQIPGFKDLSYEERLRKLRLPTLKYRRIRGDMIEMYKIMTAKYDDRVTNFIQLHESDKTTRGHQYKIKKQHVRLNIRKYSFVCRSVDIWNGLPPCVVNAPTVKSFEARLDRLWEGQPFKYNIDCDLPTKINPTSELTSEAEDGLQSERNL
jgi:hypothetical protein